MSKDIYIHDGNVYSGEEAAKYRAAVHAKEIADEVRKKYPRQIVKTLYCNNGITNGIDIGPDSTSKDNTSTSSSTANSNDRKTSVGSDREMNENDSNNPVYGAIKPCDTRSDHEKLSNEHLRLDDADAENVDHLAVSEKADISQSSVVSTSEQLTQSSSMQENPEQFMQSSSMPENPEKCKDQRIDELSVPRENSVVKKDEKKVIQTPLKSIQVETVRETKRALKMDKLRREIKMIKERKAIITHTSEEERKKNGRSTELVQAKASSFVQAGAEAKPHQEEFQKWNMKANAVAAVSGLANATGINASAQCANVEKALKAQGKMSASATGANIKAQGINFQSEVALSKNLTVSATGADLLAQGINVQTEVKATANEVARATGAKLTAQGLNVATEVKATSNRSALATAIDASAQGISMQTEVKATSNQSAAATGLLASAQGIKVENEVKVTKDKKAKILGFSAETNGIEIKNGVRTQSDQSLNVSGGSAHASGLRVQNYVEKGIGSNSLDVSGLNVDVAAAKIGHTHVSDIGLGARFSACNVQASGVDFSTSTGSSSKLSLSLVNVNMAAVPKAPSTAFGLNFALFNLSNNLGFGGGGGGGGGEGAEGGPGGAEGGTGGAEGGPGGAEGGAGGAEGGAEGTEGGAGGAEGGAEGAGGAGGAGGVEGQDDVTANGYSNEVANNHAVKSEWASSEHQEDTLSKSSSVYESDHNSLISNILLDHGERNPDHAINRSNEVANYKKRYLGASCSRNTIIDQSCYGTSSVVASEVNSDQPTPRNFLLEKNEFDGFHTESDFHLPILGNEMKSGKHSTSTTHSSTNHGYSSGCQVSFPSSVDDIYSGSNMKVGTGPDLKNCTSNIPLDTNQIESNDIVHAPFQTSTRGESQSDSTHPSSTKFNASSISNGQRSNKHSVDIISTQTELKLDTIDELFQAAPINPPAVSGNSIGCENFSSPQSHINISTEVAGPTNSYEAHLYQNLAKELSDVMPITGGTVSQKSTSENSQTMSMASYFRKLRESHEAEKASDGKQYSSNNQNTSPQSLITNDRDEEDQQEQQEQPCGMHKNIHGFKTLGIMSSSRRVKTLGKNIHGFTG